MRPGWFEWLWNVSTYCELTASGRRVLGEVLLGLMIGCVLRLVGNCLLTSTCSGQAAMTWCAVCRGWTSLHGSSMLVSMYLGG